METRIYTVNIKRAEDGGYWASVPALQGCFTQGKTIPDVTLKVMEAMQASVGILPDHGFEIPVEHNHPRRFAVGVEVKVPKRT